MEELQKQLETFGYVPGSAGYENEEELSKGNYIWQEWFMPHENYRWKNTSLYYDKENEFTHFTSLENVYSILNDKNIRLYNLVSMDDKFELEFAKRELHFKRKIDNVKQDLFCLSMCSSKVLEDENKEHLLWKLHGRNGYGAIIKMTFESNLDLWYDFHLAKVFYGIDTFMPIKDLNSQNAREYLDPTLTCFLKLPIYSFEDEIRLVYNNQKPTTITKGGIQTYPLLYPDKLNSSDKVFYIQIPLLNFFEKDNINIFQPLNIDLWDNQPDNKIGQLPQIKITEIILGYRYTENDLLNIRSKIDFEKLGISTSISQLKKYF